MDKRLLAAWDNRERARLRDERALMRATFHRLLTGQATGFADRAAVLRVTPATAA